MTKDEALAWIATASYEDLFRKRRFGRSEEIFFQDKSVWDVFNAALTRYDQTMLHEDRVAVSKRVGWDSK